jgi:micrococcal nuclease
MKKVLKIVGGLFVVFFMIGAIFGGSRDKDANDTVPKQQFVQASTTAKEDTTPTETTSVEQKETVVKPTEQTEVSAVQQTPVPEVQEATKPVETMVYLSATGTKYHLKSCRTLKKTPTEVSLSDAKARGYDPCGVCDPPK